MQRQIFQSEFAAPFGSLFIASDGTEIVRISFQNLNLPQGQSSIIIEAWRQISEYLEGSRRDFSLPLATLGTQFFRDSWKALTEIPYGSTLTYKAVAEKLGKPKAYHAVARACALNPFPIVVPCHRVVATGGGLGGFAGGLPTKRFLLDLEQQNIAIRNRN